LLLDGTNGLSDVDGTAATPAIRGTDANTGIFFPAADTIAFSEGGVESARFNSSGNLGIGNTNPTAPLTVSSNASADGLFLLGRASDDVGVMRFKNNANSTEFARFDARFDQFIINAVANAPMIFSTNNTERMRLDSSGNLLVGTTDTGFNARQLVRFSASGTSTRGLVCWNGGGPGAQHIGFSNSGGAIIGSISQSGEGAIAYNTSSDYRLKENVQPMTGALATVAALKPCTYTWKADGSAGQGFLAHELQAVVPDCVTGEKDAVETVDDLDADGRKIGTKEVPRYQGVDTSFLVATLVAAIQELKSEFDAYKATHP
jgi:hypothetical protein